MHFNTLQQVHRMIASLLCQFGTPALQPKPRGKSTGWPKGKPRTPDPRFAVVRKPKTHRKQA